MRRKPPRAGLARILKQFQPQSGDAMSERARDHESFEQEALPWLPDVARFALSLTRDEADADDLVQDTFLTAQQNWHRYVSGTACRAWLFTICRHRFYRLRQRDDRSVAVEDPELEALAAASVHSVAAESGLADAFERAEVLAAVETAIAELSPSFRNAVLLVDVNGESYESASQALGVPIGTVRSRLFRARRLLQQRLLEHATDAGVGIHRRAEPSSPTLPMKAMADCNSVMRRLWDYLDGELTEHRMAAIREHLAVCSRCQPQAAFERSFLAAMAHARRDHSSPRSLSERVQAALRGQGYVDGGETPS